MAWHNWREWWFRAFHEKIAEIIVASENSLLTLAIRIATENQS